MASDHISWPRRGLRADKARSFLRAVDEGVATVDDAGYVTLPRLRPKTPAGRYALLGKSGEGVSINLEYPVQIGATAELVLAESPLQPASRTGHDPHPGQQCSSRPPWRCR